jgi:hypothetical protein
VKIMKGVILPALCLSSRQISSPIFPRLAVDNHHFVNYVVLRSHYNKYTMTINLRCLLLFLIASPLPLAYSHTASTGLRRRTTTGAHAATIAATHVSGRGRATGDDDDDDGNGDATRHSSSSSSSTGDNGSTTTATSVDGVVAAVVEAPSKRARKESRPRSSIKDNRLRVASPRILRAPPRTRTATRGSAATRHRSL